MTIFNIIQNDVREENNFSFILLSSFLRPPVMKDRLSRGTNRSLSTCIHGSYSGENGQLSELAQKLDLNTILIGKEEEGCKSIRETHYF